MPETAEHPPATPEPPTAQSPVIVHYGWGGYSVYPATIDLARTLVKDKIAELGEDAVAGMRVLNTLKIFRATPEDLAIPYLVSEDVVLKAMKDVLSFEVGQASGALYRVATPGPLEKGATLTVTKAVRDELVLWAFDNKFDVSTATAPKLNSTGPEKTLSFLAGIVSRAKGHPCQYAYASDMAESDELQVLLYSAWKPTAKVENVVQRYLSLLNTYCSRDEQYNLGVMETPSERQNAG